MPAIFSVYLNGKKILNFEKTDREPGIQRRFFDKMDIDMDEGFELNGEMINSPDKLQRANYVTLSLLYSVETKNKGMISATCGYLTNRLPDLNQIHATEHGQDVTLDFIYDEDN